MDPMIEILNETFVGFRLDATCIAVKRHRHYGFFDVKLGPKCQVAQIQRKLNEIALKLRSLTVPIVKSIPREGIVRLQVVLSDPTSISLDSLFERAEDEDTKGLLPFVLGESDSGEVLWTDMSQNPHMIVAGAPGSGKSVLLHNLIANAARCPNTKLFLVDPKGVEFNQYAGPEMSHVVNEVATSYEETLFMLDFLIQEMEDRYKILAENKLQSIEQNPELFEKFVIIIDEVADLMMNDSTGKFEANIVRLAQKSRAAGIYIVLGTQRPSVDVITGLIKANFEARIACRVSSKYDSQIILGQPGAERLIGKGDAIISNKTHSFVRMQIGFITPQNVIRNAA